MTTTTWDVPPDMGQQLQTGAKLRDFVLYVVGLKAGKTEEGAASAGVSHGMTEEEVDRNTRMAHALPSSYTDSGAATFPATSGPPFGNPGLLDTEKAMLALVRRESREAVPEPETLDWEMISRPRARERGTLAAALRNAGRGKPLPDPDPWA